MNLLGRAMPESSILVARAIEGARIVRSADSEENCCVKIEILHIDECPNWEDAGRGVRAALDATGHPEVEINYRLLLDSSEAAQVPFAGSPTILIDGVDAFPSEGRTSDLACRIYRTPTGFAGIPTVDQLIEVLRKKN
jgi:hypothetical protein